MLPPAPAAIRPQNRESRKDRAGMYMTEMKGIRSNRGKGGEAMRVRKEERKGGRREVVYFHTP